MAKTGRLIDSSGSVTAYAPTPLTIDDGAAVADLELARGDHLVADGKPVDDLDAAFAPCPGHHLGEHHLAVDDLEHVLGVALRDDGLLGHAQGIFFQLQEHGHAGEETRAQALILVRHERPHQQAAAGNVEPRIDGVDLALEDVLRVGVDLDANGLADPDRRQEPLRHPEISLDRIDGLQIDEGLTRVMYSPALTWRKPTMPENGATMRALSSCTRASSTVAVFTARLDVASSTD